MGWLDVDYFAHQSLVGDYRHVHFYAMPGTFVNGKG